ncbi:MAG: hypothetical protein FWC47_08575 [Oscillospiraceae bacterium]|nr:hypothetical protein [Oscillospiraceae bacterium]
MDKLNKKKVLVLVEGKTDKKIMRKLFESYEELDIKYEIVAYCTNIYVLYKEYFHNQIIQDSLDLLQVLRSREKEPNKKLLFDDKYTDILLIFDLDPQEPQFSSNKISQMQNHFNESSDNGKLYINYPMVESFYHRAEIPDPNYINLIIAKDELKKYKSIVNEKSKGRSCRKFAIDKNEFNKLILLNLEKAFKILGKDIKPLDVWIEINMVKLLEKQLVCLQSNFLYVLCTCIMYIYDYNYKLLL